MKMKQILGSTLAVTLAASMSMSFAAPNDGNKKLAAFVKSNSGNAILEAKVSIKKGSKKGTYMMELSPQHPKLLIRNNNNSQGMGFDLKALAKIAHIKGGKFSVDFDHKKAIYLTSEKNGADVDMGKIYVQKCSGHVGPKPALSCIISTGDSNTILPEFKSTKVKLSLAGNR